MPVCELYCRVRVIGAPDLAAIPTGDRIAPIPVRDCQHFLPSRIHLEPVREWAALDSGPPCSCWRVPDSHAPMVRLARYPLGLLSTVELSSSAAEVSLDVSAVLA